MIPSMRSESEKSPSTAHSTMEHGIVTLYQIVHDAIHAKSGQTGALKLQYIRTEKEIVMGRVSVWLLNTIWSDLVVSDNPTVRIVLSLRLPKTINAANVVTR
ncbi:hypothetical protein BDR07DRAFT_791855 [Suillus spraguei]|nr:hypothetical protein BDR07DRAFT_791855 [Suillus spraguei]